MHELVEKHGSQIASVIHLAAYFDFTAKSLRPMSFRLVILPIMLPGIAVGVALSFMISFDDVTAPIFLSGSTAAPLPKMMLDALDGTLLLSPQGS
ncbi:MAG: hypothetical protein KUA37_11615 [Desulfomicrobium sp.]|uniref:hypothetical protein n=1 Tax=Hoeflea sp. TaxID=1940281 RepID=UPI0025C29F66|nr:hypothetical protein [Hoeflea sp.]MBU4529383.1 hypothetical protein [Alphaproteobacteria bacterium]MBV1712633.1 hypothetical protein [Desulfomicrobium sp.]MBU4544794.1 hypothetical protein [Alphaproteobacteria bacterium]MBU4548816.1 hypothetical protein [Alphaproteobacteria bacterium]MBV1785039.1 hypothetical protein [Hoeflea sp.]